MPSYLDLASAPGGIDLTACQKKRPQGKVLPRTSRPLLPKGSGKDPVSGRDRTFMNSSDGGEIYEKIAAKLACKATFFIDFHIGWTSDASCPAWPGKKMPRLNCYTFIAANMARQSQAIQKGATSLWI